MGGVCCPCWPSHEYTEIPTSAPDHTTTAADSAHHKKKKDCHVAFQNEEIVSEINHSHPNSHPQEPEENLLSNNDSQGAEADNSLPKKVEEEETKQSIPAPEIKEEEEKISVPTKQESQQSHPLLDLLDNPFPEEKSISPAQITLEDTTPAVARTEELSAFTPVAQTPTLPPQSDIKVDESIVTTQSKLDEPIAPSQSFMEEVKVDNQLRSTPVESKKYRTPKPGVEMQEITSKAKAQPVHAEPRQPSPKKLKSNERKCGRCGEIKPQSEFSGSQLKKQTQAGHVLKCKQCVVLGG
jgi:hypothetical protein